MARPLFMQPTAPPTFEQRYALEFAEFRRNRSKDQVPDAQHTLAVGMLVQHGREGEARIDGFLDDRKIVCLSYDKGIHNDKLYDHKRRMPWFQWWMDVEPLAPIEETSFARPRLHTQYMHNLLRFLLSRCYTRGLFDSPEYQRDYVWTLADKERLIHSIFNRMDIGKFVFLSYWSREELEVIDGKQRLRAIMDFYEGRFAYEGKRWNQLSWLDKFSFLDLQVQTCELDTKHVKKADVLWLFLAINSGGVPQSPELVKRAQEMYLQEAGKLEAGTIE